jgi:hypothetical protein
MADWEDVARIALALPETDEHLTRGKRAWRVKQKLFVWERPLRTGEIEQLGAAAPDGPVMGARVEHLGTKEALLGEEAELFFTTPHFEGYAAVLLRLDRIAVAELGELIVEAWFARAPVRLAERYSADQLRPSDAGR